MITLEYAGLREPNRSHHTFTSGHDHLHPNKQMQVTKNSLTISVGFVMARKPNQQDRLEALAAICRALPETSREDKGAHAAFLVRGKTFAWYLNNHHGDNMVSVCCKVLPGENQRLMESNPDRFFMPAYLGSRGWIGLRM